MNEKIEKEKQLLSLFKQLYKDFPKAKIIKRESPDFVLQLSPKKCIGVELTEIVDSLNNDSLLQTILKKEDKIYLYQRIKPHRLWLIIYTNVNSKFNTTELEINDIVSSFDKVFLFLIINQHIIELK